MATNNKDVGLVVSLVLSVVSLVLLFGVTWYFQSSLDLLQEQVEYDRELLFKLQEHIKDRDRNSPNNHYAIKRQSDQNCQCKDGFPGPMGPPGNKGEMGIKGFKGDTGPPGPRGDAGGRGLRGQIGDPGYPGPPGLKGEKGEKGSRGRRGSVGSSGAKGEIGLQGDKGDKGEKGDMGHRGFNGTNGDKGDKGDMGYRGFNGTNGEKGDKGDMGYRGFNGTNGFNGTKGQKGDMGHHGLNGTNGVNGTNGLNGTNGFNGTNGLNGTNGFNGINGLNGTKGDKGDMGHHGLNGTKGDKGDKGDTGLTGAKGDQGLKGEKGSSGSPGSTGLTGPKGAPGQKGMKGDKEERNGGTVYVRWGHDQCPSTARLVYSGRAGGSHYTHSGGGSNPQCLPLDPNFLTPISGTQSSRAYMYGAEYETHTDSNSHIHGRHNTDVPCAVCHVSNRTAVYMVPAKYTCPTGWITEYYGYLMAEHFRHPRSQFTCVDTAFKSVHKSSANSDGLLFQFVEARCGSLPCPPYGNGKELSCAVCTK